VPMTQLLVKLQRDDGKAVNQGFGPMGRGDKVSLPLEGAPGKHSYKGEVIVGQGGSEQTASVAFETQVTDNLVVQVNKADIDLAAGQLKLSASRAIARVDITVLPSLNNSAGKKISQTFSDNEVGQPVLIKFPVAQEGIARLDIIVTDTQGFYSGVSLMPWSVSIPHEEVIFETDKSDIAVSEQPKLDQSAKRIADAFASARALGPVQLFIAGHTDTVGNDAYNLKLSLARAQSIARYLRKKGLRLPILFEGFGERSLRVGTADETDELRNRRVDYILALEPPDLASGARWKKLP
jgi:outer membrane protein OmpA-like peptidoglycan-associated protein